MKRNRFHHILIGARFQSINSVGGVSAASGNNNRRAGLGIFVGADIAAKLETVATRGQQVAQDDFGLVVQGQFHPALAVLGIDEDQPRSSSHGTMAAKSVIVINDQNLFHAGTSY